eukprot:745693-Hanusia_phi.AAC.1
MLHFQVELLDAGKRHLLEHVRLPLGDTTDICHACQHREEGARAGMEPRRVGGGGSRRRVEREEEEEKEEEDDDKEEDAEEEVVVV